MKRTLLLAMSFFSILWALCLNAYATQDSSAAEKDESTVTEKTVLDVLTEVADEQNFQELLFSDGAVADELKDYSIAGKPIILAFRTLLCTLSPDDPEGDIRKIWNEEKYGTILVTAVENDVSEEGVSFFTHAPSYVLTPGLAGTTWRTDSLSLQQYHGMEITLNGSAQQQFCGNQHMINYVLFLGEGNYFDPARAVYFTNGGVFVRVFWGESYREYTWKDYAEYYNAYVEYEAKLADELYGSASGGGGSFIDFIDNIYPTLGEEDTQTNPEKPTYTWAYIVGTCLLVCGVVTVVVIRKQKTSASAQREHVKE